MKSLLPSVALGLTMAGCVTASTKAPAPWVDATKDGACMVAAVLDQQCSAGIERDPDKCLYARVIDRVCRAADAVGERQGIAAAAPGQAGSGFTPRGLTTFYRVFPGGPESRSTGDPSADPWAVACQGKAGPALAACLRSRFLESSPAVCAEYTRAFGVNTCGTPAGGWTRGPSNERWGSALAALNYLCEVDPAVIGSTGRAGGWDCESTAVEWARLGAFGGEAIVTEWQRRTNPPAPVPCPNGRIDPGETCATCPADAGACPPPPTDSRLDCSTLELPPPGAPQFVARKVGVESTGLASYELFECRGGSLPTPEPARPALSAQTRQTLAKLCGLYPARWTAIRAACAAAVAEVLGVDAVAAPVAGVLRRDEGAGRWALEDRLAAARRGEPFYDNGEVACYRASNAEDFCEPSRKRGGADGSLEVIE